MTPKKICDPKTFSNRAYPATSASSELLRACFFLSFRIFSGRFDTSRSMIPHLVPEIEGGYPERDGEGGEEEEEEGGEGLVLENSRSWMKKKLLINTFFSTATPKREEEPGTVYKTVDFIKTEAFNRTRQKVEEYKYNIKPESK